LKSEFCLLKIICIIKKRDNFLFFFQQCCFFYLSISEFLDLSLAIDHPLQQDTAFVSSYRIFFFLVSFEGEAKIKLEGVGGQAGHFRPCLSMCPLHGGKTPIPSTFWTLQLHSLHMAQESHAEVLHFRMDYPNTSFVAIVAYMMTFEILRRYITSYKKKKVYEGEQRMNLVLDEKFYSASISILFGFPCTKPAIPRRSISIRILLSHFWICNLEHVS
jgi:hypothetical protein